MARPFWLREPPSAYTWSPLPAYAPQLNPAEGLWHALKRVELRNVITHSLPELRAQVRLASARLRHRPALLRGYVRHCTRPL